MRDYGAFELGEVSSEYFNIILTEPPQIVFAERETESISVAGRSGDLIVDRGRYKNVTAPYKCAIIPKASQSLREIAVSALSLLKPTAGYQRLENSFHRGYYRMARVSGQISIESIVERGGLFTVDFDCKPQRFLTTGEISHSFAEPSTLYNQTGFTSQPLITVYGTGPGELTVGDTTVEIKVLADQITLDCDVQNAYRQAGDAAPENRNADVYVPDFPTLAPGYNAINWTGGITGVDIVPRWWTL